MSAVPRHQRDRLGQYIRGRLHLRVVADGVQEAYSAFARAYKEEFAKEKVGTLCTPGCSACCDQLVLTTSAEAAAILARFPEVVIDAMPRFEAEADAFEKLCVEGGHDPQCLNFVAYPERSDERQRLLDAWFRLRQPCVFLDRATRRCRVYTARPAACRHHSLLDVPSNHPEMCDDRSGAFLVTLANSEAYGPLLQRLDQLMLEHYGRTEMGPLGAAVSTRVIAETNPR